ncbi:MAG: GatB/YqeY domain-containing protein [Proteobacteria bacterium]|nr:GatB/YqeY domain-containing protein [Pseudomonadota bacterium]NBY18866.1 GatB/YqeY domain-containing protein [bacterium]
MDLKTTIQNDMKTAMKSGEPLKTGCLRMLIAEIKKREIDKRSALDETEIQKTISTLIKQRNDSIDAFLKGGRQDLADKEKLEIDVLKVYLPTQLTEQEVDLLVSAAIEETGAKVPQDVGKVMKVVLAKAGGRADGKMVNELVRKKLQP